MALQRERSCQIFLYHWGREELRNRKKRGVGRKVRSIFFRWGVTYPNAILSSGDVLTQAVVRTAGLLGQHCSEQWACDTAASCSVTCKAGKLPAGMGSFWACTWAIATTTDELVTRQRSHKRHLTLGCEPPAWFPLCIPWGDLGCMHSVTCFSSAPYAFGEPHT